MRSFTYRPERALVEHIVGAGVPADQAEEIIVKVLAGTKAVLESGKTVMIPGVGRLAAPRKQSHVPSRPHLQHYFRKACLTGGTILWSSEPWEPIDYSRKAAR